MSDRYSIVLNPTVFSVWYLILSAVPNLIGGGGSVVIAMVWTILTDAVSPEKRTSLFYQMHAMMLLLSIVFRPIAGWMLSINPWLSMWTGLGSLALSTCMTLLIPETLHLSQSSGGHSAHGQVSHLPPLGPKQSVIRTAWNTARKDASRVWQLLHNSKNLLPIVLALAFYSPIHIAFEMNMLQYVTKRFDWDWSKVRPP
jgi:MFS family permease